MATDYDEARPDVVEATEKTLDAVKKIDAPNAKSVRDELDESDFSDGAELPGAFVDEELTVQVVPQKDDEFICPECFTIRHRCQATTLDGARICRDCMLEYA